MNVNLLKKKLKNIFFNESWTCANCRKEIFSGYFCGDCTKKAIKVKDNKCAHCGRITPYPVPVCKSCSGKNLNFDIARSSYSYALPISNLIQRFKYENARYLAVVFAKDLQETFIKEGLSADAIVYVPSSKERFKERGYNQANLLAKELSKLINLPVLDAIEKIKETEQQANLSASKRRENLKSSFKVDKKLVEGKALLLIDDVLTTGSTADVISERLKKAGALKVSVLTVASVSVEGE